MSSVLAAIVNKHRKSQLVILNVLSPFPNTASNSIFAKCATHTIKLPNNDNTSLKTVIWKITRFTTTFLTQEQRALVLIKEELDPTKTTMLIAMSQSNMKNFLQEGGTVHWFSF